MHSVVAHSDQLTAEMLSHLNPAGPVVDQDADSKVAAFYAGRSVLITGATGFIGKALIEKLLRSCAGIQRIYILVREKRGKGLQDRLHDIIQSQCFDRIRERESAGDKEAGDRLLLEKLHPIRGDIAQARFGISADDMKLLSRDVSVVINSAATTRFTEQIDVAYKNNIYSVGQLVELCDQLGRLEALVHLSTAYSNCHKSDLIDEIFYRPPMSGDQLAQAIGTIHEIEAQIHVTPELGGADDDPPGQGDIVNGNLVHRSACEWQHLYFDGLKFSPSDASRGLFASECGGDSKAVAAVTTKRLGGQTEGDQAYNLMNSFARVALSRAERPNTYTLTKAISENYLLDKVRARPRRYLGADGIPVAIVRPSIVGAAWREPLVGFVDNLNGATGAILSHYTGALQAMPGEGKMVADLVPVDMVTNMILCAGRFLVEQKQKQQQHQQRDGRQEKALARIKQDQGVYLFNFVSGSRNPLRWQLVEDLTQELSYKFPSDYLVRLPSAYFIRAGKLWDYYDLLNHKLPAYLTDLINSYLYDKSQDSHPVAMRTYAKMRQMTDTLVHFTTNQWLFSDTNTRSLFESLDAADKQVFPFDVAAIDWRSYMMSYIIGARVYTMGDAPENLPRAMAKMRRRLVANAISMALLALLTFWLFARQLD